MNCKCVCIVFYKDEMSKNQALLIAKSKINVTSYTFITSIDRSGVSYSLYASESELSESDFHKLAEIVSYPDYSEDELDEIYGDGKPFFLKENTIQL